MGCCCFDVDGLAQNRSSVQRFTADDGLSQNLVFDIEQDRRGYLWLGTKDGLNRYDGYRFKAYRANSNTGGQLLSNYVTLVKEDQDGGLWVETRPGGLHRYDHTTDEVEPLCRTSPCDSLFKTSGLTDVYGGAAIGWFFATTKGLFVLDDEDGQVSPFPLPDLTDLYISQMQQESDSTIVVATRYNGLFRLNVYSRECQALTHFSPHLETEVYYFARLEDGGYIVLTGRNVIHTDHEGRLMARRTIPPTEQNKFHVFRGVYVTGEATAVIIHGYTVYYLDLRTGQLTVGIGAPLAISFHQDRSGIYWIGTAGYGLYKYNPLLERFGFTATTFFDYLAPNFMNGVEQAFGPFETRYWLDIMSVQVDLLGNHWILSRRAGLFRSTSSGQITERFRVEAPGSIANGTNALAVVTRSDGSFDVLTRRHILNVRPGASTRAIVAVADLFEEYKPSPNVPIFEPLTALHSGYGQYWAGSVEFGLAVFDSATATIRRFKHKPDDYNSISANHILSLCADPLDPEQFMWVGTDGGGLNRIHIPSGTVMRHTEAEGLPNNVIYGMYADSSGWLWMSSNKGIIRMHPRTLEHSLFTYGDGLQSSEFNRREHLKLPDGRIVFGGSFGVNVFDPNRIVMNPHSPQVVLTDVQVMNRSVLPFSSSYFREVGTERELMLDYGENMVTFELATLEFSAPMKNQYRYRFPPFLAEWTDQGTRREITFTNLDPGRYTLEVMGSNNDGTWSTQPFVMEVVVFPPFWLTIWFRAVALGLFGVGIALVVWSISRRKHRLKIRALQQQMAVDAERLRISRDMHDDIGSRLTQIRLLSEMHSTTAVSQERNPDVLTQISTLSRTIITTFGEIVWSLNPQNDALSNLIDYVVTYTETYCRDVGWRCRLDVDDDIPELNIGSSVRHHVLSVVKEAVHNAVKYSMADELRLSCSINGSVLHIVISDNGVGFDPNRVSKTGHGLGFMRKRAEMIGGTIRIDSQHNQGTRIHVEVDVQAHTKG